jgi:hypothetical protein
MLFVRSVLGVTEVGTNSFLTLFAYFFPVFEDIYAEMDKGDEKDIV